MKRFSSQSVAMSGLNLNLLPLAFRATALIATLTVYNCLPSIADDAANPPSTPPPLGDARSLLQFLQSKDAHKLPIDLKVENATVEDVATRVQRILSASPLPALKGLRVQTRNVAPVRLTFTAKNSTVGKVLSSTAFLASAKLWTLPGYFLLAPKEALTPAELELLNKENSFFTLYAGPPLRAELTPEIKKSFVNFISDEIRTSPGFNGDTSRISFAQLSPDSQAMLQQLTQSSNGKLIELASGTGSFAGLVIQPLSLNSDSTVKFPGTHGNLLEISTPTSSTPAIVALSWRADGNDGSSGISRGHRPSTKMPPNSLPKAPFVDPSAGKS